MGPGLSRPALSPHCAASTVSLKPTALVTATSVESRGFHAPIRRDTDSRAPSLATHASGFDHLGNAASGFPDWAQGCQHPPCKNPQGAGHPFQGLAWSASSNSALVGFGEIV